MKIIILLIVCIGMYSCGNGQPSVITIRDTSTVSVPVQYYDYTGKLVRTDLVRFKMFATPAPIAVRLPKPDTIKTTEFVPRFLPNDPIRILIKDESGKVLKLYDRRVDRMNLDTLDTKL